jgi:hypothetical protein
MRISAFCLAAVLSASPVHAQDQGAGNARSPDDRWQLTLADGTYLWDVRLVKLAGDTIHVRGRDSTAAVTVAQVNEFRLIRKSEMQLGTPGGAMAALTGADDEVYDLTPLDFADRLRAVQKIFLYHPPGEQ